MSKTKIKKINDIRLEDISYTTIDTDKFVTQDELKEILSKQQRPRSNYRYNSAMLKIKQNKRYW